NRAEAIHAQHPGKKLACHCSPSFNWKAALDDDGVRVPVRHPRHHPQLRLRRASDGRINRRGRVLMDTLDNLTDTREQGREHLTPELMDLTRELLPEEVWDAITDVHRRFSRDIPRGAGEIVYDPPSPPSENI